MATVIFYEKPGCGTNARQKRMLEIAGHTIVTRNLLAEPWTAERLRQFFGTTPVPTWFNPAAPRVKSNEIDPARLSSEEALGFMLKDPLLIRRPLIEADGCFCAGFDREPVTLLLGPNDEEIVHGCSRHDSAGRCPDPLEPRVTSQP